MSNVANSCECLHVHTEAIKAVKALLPSDETLFELSDLFKLFGDTTRIKILYLLFEKELCVCDIATILNMTHSAISHQLSSLKKTRLIRSRKDGKVVYYSLNDDHIEDIFVKALEHIRHD